MKSVKLTTDEFDALAHIGRGPCGDRVNACVGRNAKRLSGLKLVKYSRDGRLTISESGTSLLFVRRCILALRALAADAGATVDADVVSFLSKKSHIVARAEGGFEVSAKGLETLADMDATG